MSDPADRASSKMTSPRSDATPDVERRLSTGERGTKARPAAKAGPPVDAPNRSVGAFTHGASNLKDQNVVSGEKARARPFGNKDGKRHFWPRLVGEEGSPPLRIAGRGYGPSFRFNFPKQIAETDDVAASPSPPPLSAAGDFVNGASDPMNSKIKVEGSKPTEKLGLPGDSGQALPFGIALADVSSAPEECIEEDLRSLAEVKSETKAKSPNVSPKSERRPSVLPESDSHRQAQIYFPKKKKKRSYRTQVSFLLLVCIPTLVVGGYYFFNAEDQYVTEFQFSVVEQTPALPSSTSGADKHDDKQRSGFLDEYGPDRFVASRRYAGQFRLCSKFRGDGLRPQPGGSNGIR